MRAREPAPKTMPANRGMAATTKPAVAAAEPTAPTVSSTLGINRDYRENDEKRREGEKATHAYIVYRTPPAGGRKSSRHGRPFPSTCGSGATLHNACAPKVGARFLRARLFSTIL